MRLIRSAVSVGFFTVVSRILGFVREWLQAHYLGVSFVTDALNYAISFPSFFRRIFAEGALNASFVPLFTGILTSEGKEKALQFAQYILSYLTFIVSAIVLLVLLSADVIFSFLLKGWTGNPKQIALAVSFTRITFPFLLLISWTAFFSGVLNSFERFVAAASSPAMGNMAIITTLVSLTDLSVEPGVALSLGILACGIAQVLWVYVPLVQSGVTLKICRPYVTPHVKTFFKRIGPAALGASVFQVNLIVDMFLSSFLPKGSFSYLKYADRFNQLPLSVIGTAIATALLPMMAKALKKKDRTHAMIYQNRAVEFVLFFVIPAAVGLIFLAEDLIALFYLHGKFKVENIVPTAQTLAVLATGLPAYVLAKVFSTSFFSSGDTRTPVITAIIAVFLNLGFNLWLIWDYAQLGMAAATSLSAWLNTAMLVVCLWKRQLFIMDQKLVKFLKRMFFVLLLFIFYCQQGLPFIRFYTVLSLPYWLQAPSLVAITLGVYLLLGYVFRVFSLQRIQEHLSEDVDA